MRRPQNRAALSHHLPTLRALVLRLAVPAQRLPGRVVQRLRRRTEEVQIQLADQILALRAHEITRMDDLFWRDSSVGPCTAECRAVDS